MQLMTPKAESSLAWLMNGMLYETECGQQKTT